MKNTGLNIVTHNGKFHNDEVCAIALLRLSGQSCDNIIRTRDGEVICKADYVVDVGGLYDPDFKRFDHHQKDYTGNKSSAGMVYSTLNIHSPLLTKLVKEVDFRDLNGPTEKQNHHEFFELINDLNQDDVYSDEQDEFFEYAVNKYVEYIQDGFKIPLALKLTAIDNKQSKLVKLRQRLDNLECLTQNGNKIYKGDYVPLVELPNDWSFFVSYDKGQDAWTVMASTSGHKLVQGQGIFTHKAGFISKIKPTAWGHWYDGSDGFKDAVFFKEEGSNYRYEVPVGNVYYR